MEEKNGVILNNHAITEEIWQMQIQVQMDLVPGQFVDAEIPGLFLRRPFSVSNVQANVITLIYRVVGKGTRAMTQLPSYADINLLGPCGNGFDLTIAGDHPMLIGGGLGMAPMPYLARQLLCQKKQVTVLAGFQSKKDAILLDEMQKMGCDVSVYTQDGSLGHRGLVTDGMKANATCIYTCGPMGMLQGVAEKAEVPVQVSLEARMGCGFGACMGCAVMTKNGPRRICHDGPVFNKEELLWQA